MAVVVVPCFLVFVACVFGCDLFESCGDVVVYEAWLVFDGCYGGGGADVEDGGGSFGDAGGSDGCGDVGGDVDDVAVAV